MKAARQRPRLQPVSSDEPLPAARQSWRPHAWRMLALCALVLAAYSNCFQSGLVFDSSRAIAGDARIRELTAENAGLILTQEYSSTNSGLYRPLTTFSYLVNYAVFGNGIHPVGYHWVNLALHAMNVLLVYLLGLLLFRAPLPAIAMGALWGVHPLLTESVTNIAGRADLLAAFGVLAGLLCYIRSAAAVGYGKLLWLTGMVVAQAVGLFSKENAAMLPGIMLLYDLTWRGTAAWRERAVAYSALVVPFAAYFFLRSAVHVHLAASNTDNPLLSADFFTGRLTAIKVIGKYLWLFIWPAGLSADYSYNAVPLFSGRLADWDDWKALIALVTCLGAALMAVRCYRTEKRLFFFPVFFFVALIPTSNLAILIGSIMAERFVYLPSVGLAGCLIATVCALDKRFQRTAWIALGLLCLACAGRTYARNFDWLDERSLWSSAVNVCPESAKAHYNLGTVLWHLPGQRGEAVGEFEAALKINPELADAQDNLGSLLAQVPGRLPDAIAHFEAALRIDPNLAEAHDNLGGALLQMPGRLRDAVAQLEEALRINPDFAEAHTNLGNALAQAPGRLPEAIAHFEAAIRINPNLAEAHAGLGNALSQAPGRLPDAAAQFEEALRINPNLAQVHNNLGIMLGQMSGRLPEAIAQFEAALRINPNLAEAHTNLGIALASSEDRLPEAIAQFESALRINPRSAQARAKLSEALAAERQRERRK